MANVSETLTLEVAGAIAAAQSYAAAVRATAEAQQEAAAASRATEAAAEAQAAALYKLETIAANTSPQAAAALAYQRMSAEITRLGEASGNAALAEQAMLSLNERMASQLTVSTAAAGEAAAANRTMVTTGEAVTHTTEAMRYGFINLGNQLSDVGVELAAGISPLTILVQQGPQIAAAVAQIGGTGAVLSGLGGILATMAPYIAGIAVAAAAAGTAWAVYSNATQTAAKETEAVNQKLIDAARNAEANAAAIEKMDSAWKAFTGRATSIEDQIAVLQGYMTKGEAEAKANRAALEEQANVKINLLAADLAANEAAEQAAIANANAAGAYSDAGRQASAAALAAGSKAAADREAMAAVKAKLEEELHNADVLGALHDKIEATKGATKDYTEAVRDAARALREFHAAGTEATPAKFDTQRVLDLAQAAAGGAPQSTIQSLLVSSEQMAKWGQAAADAAAARAASDRQALTNALLLAQANARDADATERAAHAAEARSRANATAAEVAGAATTASSASGIIGAVAASSPQGAAVVGIMQAVTNLDDTIGGLQDFVSNFLTALADAPEMLVKALPAAVRTLIPEIVKLIPIMVTELIATLPVIIVEIVRALADPQTWIDAAKAFAEGMAQAAAGLLAPEGSDVSLSGASVNPNKSVQLGTTGSGTHSGGATPTVGARTRGGGAPTVHMHYHGPVIGLGPDAARSIQHELTYTAGLFSP